MRIHSIAPWTLPLVLLIPGAWACSSTASKQAGAGQPPVETLPASQSSGVAQTAGQKVPPPWLNAFGVVTDADGLCFSGRGLDKGDEVVVFGVGSAPSYRAQAGGEGCGDEPGDRKLDGKLWHRSRIARADGIEPDGNIGIGFVKADDRLRVNADGSLDVDGNDQPDQFAVCTSGEGLHLTVWAGAVAGSERLWHSYVYLGYDTESDCQPAEYR